MENNTTKLNITSTVIATAFATLTGAVLQYSIYPMDNANQISELKLDLENVHRELHFLEKENKKLYRIDILESKILDLEKMINRTNNKLSAIKDELAETNLTTAKLQVKMDTIEKNTTQTLENIKTILQKIK